MVTMDHPKTLNNALSEHISYQKMTKDVFKSNTHTDH